jgi:Asp-tRNA(Asn)/Glu-tRNA(Gln) amidotransferase A subunit family amidase
MTLYPNRLVNLKETEDFEKEFERLSTFYSKDDSVFVSVSQYAKAYRDKKTTPLEVAKRIIQSVKESNEKHSFRSIIKLNETILLEEAKASTQRFEDGKPLSIFDGIPISVKDEADLKDYPTKLGTNLKFFSDNIAKEDAHSLRDFRKYGAMFIGKCNMAEIGISTRSLNTHPYYQIAKNPYNLKHEVGGSSSGSGSSVGSGLCPISVGADGGGSIRIPASFCGVFGLKPTSQRVPTKQDTRSVCFSIGVV